MAQPNIIRVVNEGSSISIELLNRLAVRHTQVNLHWLLTGVGEMFLDEVQVKSPQVNEAPFIKGRWEEWEERVMRLEKIVKELGQDSYLYIQH